MPTKKKPEPTPDAKRYTVASGEWYEMGAMTGRDYLAVRQMLGHRVTDTDVEAMLEIVGRRCVASSVADPIDRPIPEIMEFVMRWYSGTEDAAVPPETATP